MRLPPRANATGVAAAVLAVGVLASCVSPRPDHPQAPTPKPTEVESPVNTAPDAPLDTSTGRAIPSPLYGVTAEDVSDLDALADALGRHAKRPTTRIVFQHGERPQAYATAVQTLRTKGYVMGELLDSSDLAKVSVDDYRQRTRDYVSTFGRTIDIYEIGNELNGAWAGTPGQVNAKVRAAYDVVEKENATLDLKSALTLNYWPNPDCYDHQWEDTATFAQQLPDDLRAGLDYVFLSFYETACDPRVRPTDAQLIDAMKRLHSIFPRARIGFGEIGAQGRADGLATNPKIADKRRILARYYGLHQLLRRELGEDYVGGYFWWSYAEDAVPFDRPASMWPDVERAFDGY